MSDSCDTTYDDLIATLFSLRKPREREAGFAGMQRYAEHLGNPHRRYRTIHIAGTDGKGSVAHKIAHALSESGYRTGLFTSPHLFRYRERVTIDGEMIAEEEVASLLRRLFRLVREPRFFEVTTLLAFSYFAEKGVEVAVIETGIGGRFDMTNIIRPILTIITSIGFDHEEILGRTRDEIATEKGGIIKEGVPLIVGPDADLPLLRDKAKEKGASYTVAKKRGLGREAESIALEAFVILRHRYSIPRSAALAGSRKRAPLRFERVCDGVIVDTAHNRGGISRLFALLRKTFPGQPIR
ncbi:MAG: Mur ligase family protein, partial [Simkaniaceae bacterium]|nr:Mur ligase family protein [Simkaniaceae bacterium]